MPRIRTVKPEFWKSPKAARVSRDARLLFLGLLTEADDEGRLLASPKLLAGALFPHDDDATPKRVERWFGELVVEGMVESYEVEGVLFAFVVGFSEHQRISHPTASRHPAPSGMQPGLFGNDDANGSGTIPAGKEQGTGNREAEWETDFSIAWERYPRKEARKPALKCYLTRRREGITADELLSATKNYAAARAGEDPKFTMQGPTFYGPNERWRDHLEAPARSSNGAGSGAGQRVVSFDQRGAQ